MLKNIALTSKHPFTRIASIENENFKNEDILKEIALNDPSQSVRIAAISKIKNKDILFEIIESHIKHPSEVITALENIDLNDNIDFIKRLLNQEIDFAITTYILENIENPEIIKYEISPHLSNIRWGIEDMTNQKGLSIIAKYHPDYYDRLKACENPNLKDEALLLDIIKNNRQHDSGLTEMYWKHRSPYIHMLEIRSACLKKIENLIYLIEIAKNDPVQIIRMEAVRKIFTITNDAAILKDLVENNPQSRLENIEDINDDEMLVEIAKDDSHINVRKRAIERIDDDETLSQIAQNDLDWCVGAHAVSNITDENLLFEIYNNKDLDDKVRAEAVAQMKNQKTLKEIFIQELNAGPYDKDYLVRYAIAGVMSDEKFLLYIAMRHAASPNDKHLVMTAIENPNLKNNDHLLKIIRRHLKNENITNLAIRKISKPHYLNVLLKDKRLSGYEDVIMERLAELE